MTCVYPDIHVKIAVVKMVYCYRMVDMFLGLNSLVAVQIMTNLGFGLI